MSSTPLCFLVWRLTYFANLPQFATSISGRFEYLSVSQTAESWLWNKKRTWLQPSGLHLVGAEVTCKKQGQKKHPGRLQEWCEWFPNKSWIIIPQWCLGNSGSSCGHTTVLATYGIKWPKRMKTKLQKSTVWKRVRALGDVFGLVKSLIGWGDIQYQHIMLGQRPAMAQSCVGENPMASHGECRDSHSCHSSTALTTAWDPGTEAACIQTCQLTLGGHRKIRFTLERLMQIKFPLEKW